MNRAGGNFLLSVGTGAAGVFVTHINTVVGTVTGLLALCGAAFAVINGYYSWKRNRRDARRTAQLDKDAQALANKEDVAK